MPNGMYGGGRGRKTKVGRKLLLFSSYSIACWLSWVELERFELSSKRGINLLSTCLSSLKLSGRSKTEATNSTLILYVSLAIRGIPQTISDISAPPGRTASEQQHPGDVTSPQLLRGLSFNLLYFD